MLTSPDRNDSIQTDLLSSRSGTADRSDCLSARGGTENNETAVKRSLLFKDAIHAVPCADLSTRCGIREAEAMVTDLSLTIKILRLL